MPIVKCDYCGKEVFKDSWSMRTNKHHFCDRECSKRFNTGIINGNKIEIDKNNNCAKMFVKYKDKIINVLIDIEDIEKVKLFTWHAKYQDDIGNYYIIKNIIKGNSNKQIMLHRYIMNCPKGLTIDHINHNTTDNRKQNLRICTQRENNLNQSELRSNNKSGYRNISWQKACNKYIITLMINGKNKTIGRTADLEEAVKIRDEAKERYGIKSVYNFKRLSNRSM